MQIMKTVEMLLAEQNPKAFALLKKMLKRPGLYFGITRFDYLYEFMNGYTFDQFEQNIASGNHDNEFNMMPDAIMQYWFLHKQMAALGSGEMQARELFRRFFGTKDTAFDNYNNFLTFPVPEVSSKHPGDHTMEHFSSEHPNINGNIYWEISCFEKNNSLIRYDWEYDIPADFYDNMARALVADIEVLIKNDGFSPDMMRIYIRREPLFTQVRFMFHAEGWHDDTTIIGNPEYNERLIGIIAKARNCKTDALTKVDCDVYEQIDFSNSLDNCEINDEKTFSYQYQRWKNEAVSKIS